ncbi:ABC transporter ATP-binding protein [Echinicola marina]|uniref:ABC transporter ATP-binding protein n=1 Tax=Echinicola marina TaxID=2859768 RepID=UPI001CF6131E|nr:ABC transporter ATP-binding protein [Echinicola marina]UCS91986.1 ABC transporter ATP-binding protein [Echinicola marina]
MKTVIKVENLSKRYRIGLKEKKADTLAQQLVNTIKYPFQNFQRIKNLGRFQEDQEEGVHWALKDVSFEVKEGEVLGIIGKNGAGKSTLLKILSKITEPTSGRIEINGRIAALLEVGTGFHPELSGRENIYMNGTILGMTKREIDHKLDEIIDFSGVEKYIDTPVKFYSSGMRVRLGFSVAAHLEPEILVIDEVLAVGDFEFQKKCLGKMEDVSKNEGRTVLFVSHNMGAVRSLCNAGIVLQDGYLKFLGSSRSSLQYYLSNNLKVSIPEHNFEFLNLKNFQISCDGKDDMNNSIPHDKDFQIYIRFESIKNISNVIIALLLKDNLDVKISSIHIKPFNIKVGKNEVRVFIKGGLLTPNSFKWLINIHDEYDSYLYLDGLAPFKIFDNGSTFYKWENIDYGRVFLNYNYE